MHRKVGVFLLVFVSIVVTCFLAINIRNEMNAWRAEAQGTGGNILYVGGTGANNYTSIQDAINDANDGDTIYVYAGIYYENIIINKSITLIGEDRNTTIIDGSNAGDVINIAADGVTIEEFTIRNSGSNSGDAGISVSYLHYIWSLTNYSWIEISSIGTPIYLSDDDYNEIDLPFNFEFYGLSYSSIYVSSNGLLTFDYGSDEYSNDPIPYSDAPNSFLAPFWDDLNPSYGGAIYYQTIGYYPDRVFIVEYKNVPHCSEVGGITFEVLLYENSSRIAFQYKDVFFGDASYDFGASATVGIEDKDGNDGIQCLYNTPSLVNSTAIEIIPLKIHLKNVTIKNCNITNCNYGIWLYYSSSNSISNCNISNNWDGIGLDSSNNNSIYNCNISNHNEGIVLSDSSNNNSIYNCSINNNCYGISVDEESSNNSIYKCNIYSNSLYGLGLGESSNNSIYKCNISNNDYGILLYYSSNNSIYKCNISNNDMDGVYPYYSSNNEIYMNNFMNSDIYSVGSNNTWHSPMPVTYTYNGVNYTSYLGNYYDYYNGIDANGDGIGDTAYQIDKNDYDYYPLTMPWENYIGGVGGRVHNLNKDTWYNSIQDAINDANDGDTIFVYSGIYYENVVINKSITLIGEDRNTTIIDGNHAGDVIRITAGWVNMSGFTVTGSGIWPRARIKVESEHNRISNNIVADNAYGMAIYLHYSSNNTITNCYIYNNDYGIGLEYSSNNTITNCYIYNNYAGIGLEYSSNNTIIGNTFTNDGIAIYGGLADCIQTIENNTVNGKPLYYFLNMNGVIIDSIDVGQLILVNCTNFNIKNLDISYTYMGIDLLYSSNNTITNCYIYNNSFYGITLYSSSNNTITNCYIYNNYSSGIKLHFSSNNTITNCYIYNNFCGICLYSSSNNTITNCYIYNNYAGIGLEYSSNNQIHYCNIYNNNDYGVYNCNFEPEYQVNASYNWWSSADGPSDAGPGSGDSVSGNVIYDPWLTEPWENEQNPVLYVHPTSHDFGEMDVGQTANWDFYIENTGGGTLSWDITESLSWLSVNKYSEYTTTETDTITVTVNTNGLTSGHHYSGYIYITSNGGNDQVYIELDTTKPFISRKALVIGCWDYPGKENDLPSPKYDIENIVKFLKYGFNFDIFFVDQNPAKQTIISHLKEFKKITRENDIKFFYYAGHGIKSYEAGLRGECLAPTDAYYVGNTPINVIWDYELRNIFMDMKNTAILFDCCYSGGLCHATDDDPDDYLYNGIGGDSKIVLMSCNSTQISLGEKPLFGEPYYLFTHYFIEAFTSGRDKARNLFPDDSHRVSIEEAFLYAKQKIEEKNPYWFKFKRIWIHPKIYDAWPTQNSNYKQFYLSDEPINNYWSVQAHSPVHLHAYDEQGRHVGLNENGGIDREIPGVYYSGPWVENETIIIFNPENYSNIRIVGVAYDDGNFTLENKKYTKENRTMITTIYETIFVQNGSIVTVDVDSGEFGDMKVDENGDGNIDREIQTHVLPVANFVYSTKNNQTFTFNASSSFDPDGQVISYHWSFGDGSTAIGKAVTHSYKKSGNYTVTLTVTDNESYTNTYSLIIYTKVKEGGGIPGFELIAFLAAMLAVVWVRRKR